MKHARTLNVHLVTVLSFLGSILVLLACGSAAPTAAIQGRWSAGADGAMGEQYLIDFETNTISWTVQGKTTPMPMIIDRSEEKTVYVTVQTGDRELALTLRLMGDDLLALISSDDPGTARILTRVN